MAMVLASTTRITPMTTQDTTWIARRMAEVMDTKPRAKACSVSVRVSARLFWNSSSTWADTRGARSGRATLMRNHPTLSARLEALFFNVSLR